MSDHVVVKREWLESVSRTLDVAGTTATEYIEWIRKAEKLASEADAILSAKAPEMVPMSEVDNLISAIEHYRDECPSDPDLTHGFYAAGLALESTIHAFNAKFKP